MELFGNFTWKRGSRWYSGTVKQVVSSAVSSMEAIVQSADGFIQIAIKHCKKTEIIGISREAIKRNYNDNDLENFWKEISAVSGTLNIHSVTPNDDGVSVLSKIYSSSSNNKRHVLLKDIHLAINNTDPAEAKICNRNFIPQYVLVKFNTNVRVRKFVGQILEEKKTKIWPSNF